MRHHHKILAIIYMVYSLALFSIMTFIGLIFGTASVFEDYIYMPFQKAYFLGPDLVLRAVPLWFVSFVIPALIAIPALIGGIGLFLQRSWARTVLIIVGIVCLLDFPAGTALGIYTLWVFLRRSANEELPQTVHSKLNG